MFQAAHSVTCSWHLPSIWNHESTYKSQQLTSLNPSHIAVNPNLTLTFQPQNHITCGYPKVIHYTKFQQFGIIFLSYVSDKQTHKQTEKNVLPTPTDNVRNYKNSTTRCMAPIAKMICGPPCNFKIAFIRLDIWPLTFDLLKLITIAWH